MTALQRSTAPGAQAALAARLAARPELEGVLVQVGLPAEEQKQTDRIYIAAVDELARTAQPGRLAALAPGSRSLAGLSSRAQIFQETYRLPVLVECLRYGRNTRGEVNDRMWAMIAELEQELADDVELVDDVDNAYVQEIPSAFTAPASDGWIGKAVLHVHVDALCLVG